MTTNNVLQAAISAALMLSGCTPPHHTQTVQTEATATPTPGTESSYASGGGGGGGGPYGGGAAAMAGQPPKDRSADTGEVESHADTEAGDAAHGPSGDGEGGGHGGGIGGSGTGGEGG